ncbi:MAG: CTP synthase [Armatimonadota bacterium]
MAKYIFVTGGVVSSIGKGIAAASLGRLLRCRGLKVAPIKFDPYVNVDAGTMNPYQHGEVFVTDDGAETDLDLGHYERFVDVNMTKHSNVTTGKVYGTVIEKERRGEYLGGTVQVIPHITNEIQDRIELVAKQSQADVIISEIGGTIGDIESLPFLEAIRQFKKRVGHDNVMYIHVTLVPSVGPWNEVKTKPTQHSVHKMREIGIQPDVLICRSKVPLNDDVKEKIALFCDVDTSAVIECLDASTIYEVPLLLEEAGLCKMAMKRLCMEPIEPDLSEWQALVDIIKRPKYRMNVAVVGKYVDNGDAYISIGEALKHAGIARNARVNVEWIDSEVLEGKDIVESLKEYDAVVCAGGFGARGLEGKIGAIQYARENGVPFLGLCLGLQMAIIEFARNACGLEGANTEEVDENCSHPVIHLLPEQKGVTDKGATMRLGAWPCRLVPKTKAEKLYKDSIVYERHRHRYEVNNEYRDRLSAAGMVFSGLSPDSRLVEIIELENHPFFMATQFHPEFKSRPNRQHPLFVGLIQAALDHCHHRKWDKD